MSVFSLWVYEKIATCAMVFRKPALAHEYWRRILEASPERTQVRAMRAHQLAQEGKTEIAIAEFERVLARQPDDKNTWFNLGFLQQQQGAHAQAIVAFEKCLALDDALDRAWFGKGLSHKALQHHEKAITCFKKTNQLQPLSPHGFYELAIVQRNNNDLDACEKTMRRVSAFDPKVAAQLEDETGIQIGVDRWWLRR
jgi:tetratricopeptide (TPR) repeat protein